jgi:hypothetical protein
MIPVLVAAASRFIFAINGEPRCPEVRNVVSRFKVKLRLRHKDGS